jgi:hypothetical protein
MQKTVHTIAWITGMIIITLYSSGCKKKEDIQLPKGRPEKPMELFFGKDINVNRPKIIHLYKDTVYTLTQFLERRSGEQLIIDEGTLIKAVSGSASYIIIDPGAVILANGTAANPIIFTSNAETGTQNANWGGLIIQGNAVDNSLNPHGDPADFSGSLNYVRVEFAKLNLTGVGNKSLVQNVQVSYSSSNSFEINGGSFNARNLVSYACGGPADIYISRGYSGKMQNILAYRHPFFASTGYTNAGIYIENNPDNPGGATPNTMPVISNATVLGPGTQNGTAAPYADTNKRSAALVTTKNAGFHIRNSLFLAFPEGSWYLDDALTADAIRYGRAEADYSVFHSNDSSRAFYLQPLVYPPFANDDFKKFELTLPLHNELRRSIDDLLLQDAPYPKDNSPVLQGADFSGASFSDDFFNKVSWRGALGKESWLAGWTNFTPLTTKYN